MSSRWGSSFVFLCLQQVIGDSLFIPSEAYSHQWLRCGERFFGQYTPEERFRGRLRDWRLGERVSPVGFVCGMSNAVGGRSALLSEAASGGAASISSRVPG